MDDYSALAQRISVSVREVRGCLLLSRDGMILGAYPDEEEGLARSAWLRFCVLGEPDRSFVEFPDQVWAFVKRSSYAAFAIADIGVRPGILVDQLEQMLLTAEEGRARRDTLRVPDANAAPSGKPRTSLHPSTGRTEPAEVSVRATQEPVAHAVAEPATAEAASVPADGVPDMRTVDPSQGHWKRSDPPDAGTAAEPAHPPLTAAELGAVAGPGEPGHGELGTVAPQVVGSALSREPKKLVGGAGSPSQEEGEVDRVLLAKEFSGLLQVDTDDDEAQT